MSDADVAKILQEIEVLRQENEELRRRVAGLEMEVGQLTDRVLRSSGGCTSCGV